MARRVGGEHIVSLAEFLREQGGQVQGAIQALAVKLAQTFPRFFRMAQEHQGLDAVHWLGAAFDGLHGQQRDTTE
ncbi:hypothetical protein D3C78_1324960 [compost metagenome]